MFPNWLGESRTSFKNSQNVSGEAPLKASIAKLAIYNNLEPPNQKTSFTKYFPFGLTPYPRFLDA